VGKTRGSYSAYEGIAAELRQRIACGTYPSGSSLPPNSALRTEFGVADGTVRRALAELDRAGLTVSRQGRPRIVAVPGETAGTLYERVASGIRAAIAAGRYPPGSILPGELELAVEYGVGRKTVREALAELERAGEVINRPGRRRQVAGDTEEQDALYEQIAAAIRSAIAEGEYPPGSALPSEKDLCAAHGVSRITVRKALEQLQAAGIIGQGAGGVRLVRGDG
jgi:DNA-binding GntR family transcriptional regulator